MIRDIKEVENLELILEKELDHQQKAVDAVCDVFKTVEIAKPSLYYPNPIIDIKNPAIIQNINELQNTIHPEMRGNRTIEEYLNIDVKMETGTGKTYVYTKTIFELHKRYGFNKFIIAVPSLSIKAGTKQFIEDSYVKRHFSDECNYNCEIELGVIESLTKKKGKFYFPSVIREFVKGSFQDQKKIFVLLVNMQLLTNGNMLTRDDYDYFVENFSRPYDAMRATKPIVIIDEPHRFTKDNKAFNRITEELKPQCIIRFGATFPETTTGRGKNKTIVKDYHNLVYDLNACDSFQNGLIKGISKEHFQAISEKDDKVKISNIESKESVTFQYIRKGESTKVITLKADDSLSLISESLEGITITGIDKTKVYLSNGQEFTSGSVFSTDIYTSSYQEQMLKLAIERHFETERVNFCTRKTKIKTLALFFIDDISSYRPSIEGKEPYLRIAFERLLLEKIEEILISITEHEEEYREYLLASKLDLSACHAGYFSQDNSDSDEEIAKEIDDILRNKKGLLSIKNKDGSYNTRRFLFSKWTLKEGWDNPNVFTIAKLRSSGSENSKLQEVGRGLRLPVDENGIRISNEDFMLNYIVDFTEADFAEKLVAQINSEIPAASKLTKEKIEEIAQKRNEDANMLFAKLLIGKFIDMEYSIIPENRAQFFEEYPEFTSGVPSNKITDRNKQKPRNIKIRSAAYNEIKDLWLSINQRYLLFFDKDIDSELQNVVNNIFISGVFSEVYLSSSRERISAKDGNMVLAEASGVSYKIEKPIAYNEFLQRINKITRLPIPILHNAILNYYHTNGTLDHKFINENSISNFVAKFNDWKNVNLQGRFRYAKSNSRTYSTALSNADGTPKTEIVQGRIGTKYVEGTPSDKYLYDTIAFDSPLEKDNIVTGDINEIIVYGKIPRRSIAIPTMIGGTYSPDFMYVIKKSSGEKELNIVVETKDVENKTELRGTEAIKIRCAEEFFKQLQIDGYTVAFHKQLNNKKMKQIIDEVLAI